MADAWSNVQPTNTASGGGEWDAKPVPSSNAGGGGGAWGATDSNSKPDAAADPWSNVPSTKPAAGGGWGDTSAPEESKAILEPKEPGIHPCIVLLSQSDREDVDMDEEIKEGYFTDDCNSQKTDPIDYIY